MRLSHPLNRLKKSFLKMGFLLFLNKLLKKLIILIVILFYQAYRGLFFIFVLNLGKK